MDDTAFVALAQEHLPVLYRTACSIVGNRHDAEDAVQQALLNAWRARDRARPGAERAWLLRIVINESCSLLRRRRREQPQEHIEPAAAPDNPRSSELREAIGSLPESLRTPFLLKYMEGLSEKEVAAILHLSLPGVKNRLFRARKSLQKQLTDDKRREART